MRPKCPCYGCNRRTPVCHAGCSDYADFQRDNNEYNRIIREAKDRESITISVTVKAAEKAKRKRLRRGDK